MKNSNVDIQNFNLEKYIGDGIFQIVANAIKATFKNPKESAFLAAFALSAKRAEKIRNRHEKNGDHIPAFMISSITGTCNLNCTGCYDRANNKNCHGEELMGSEWGSVFSQAEDLGISVILLAGGEPLMRGDIIREAAKRPSVLFPVFTNGTMLKGEPLAIFENSRNLVPILSIEGGEAQTDARRGKGIYKATLGVMEQLSVSGILFGASITVTSENIKAVTDDEYISHLSGMGCKVVVYVEYVPVTERELALDENERTYLENRVDELRSCENMIIISFPGDEKKTGGCLAAGRGFIHVNARGGAEPCPFAPYSDTNLKTSSLFEALKSPLFSQIRDSDILFKEHTGGCTLFDQADAVKSLAEKNGEALCKK